MLQVLIQLEATLRLSCSAGPGSLRQHANAKDKRTSRRATRKRQPEGQHQGTVRLLQPSPKAWLSWLQNKALAAGAAGLLVLFSRNSRYCTVPIVMQDSGSTQRPQTQTRKLNPAGSEARTLTKGLHRPPFNQATTQCPQRHNPAGSKGLGLKGTQATL